MTSPTDAPLALDEVELGEGGFDTTPLTPGLDSDQAAAGVVPAAPAACAPLCKDKVTAYWEEHFSANENEEDWLVDYSGLREHLHWGVADGESPTAISRTEPVLVVGCGLGNLGPDMTADGFKRVINTDVARSAVVAMEGRYPDQTWMVSDATDMRPEFPDGGTIACVIDKGTSDTLQFRAKAAFAELMFAEVFRVLRPGGKYFVITPRRKAHKQLQRADWSVELAATIMSSAVVHARPNADRPEFSQKRQHQLKRLERRAEAGGVGPAFAASAEAAEAAAAAAAAATETSSNEHLPRAEEPQGSKGTSSSRTVVRPIYVFMCTKGGGGGDAEAKMLAAAAVAEQRKRAVDLSLRIKEYISTTSEPPAPRRPESGDQAGVEGGSGPVSLPLSPEQFCRVDTFGTDPAFDHVRLMEPGALSAVRISMRGRVSVVRRQGQNLLFIDVRAPNAAPDPASQSKAQLVVDRNYTTTVVGRGSRSGQVQEIVTAADMYDLCAAVRRHDVVVAEGQAGRSNKGDLSLYVRVMWIDAARK